MSKTAEHFFSVQESQQVKINSLGYNLHTDEVVLWRVESIYGDGELEIWHTGTGEVQHINREDFWLIADL